MQTMRLMGCVFAGAICALVPFLGWTIGECITIWASCYIGAMCLYDEYQDEKRRLTR